MDNLSGVVAVAARAYVCVVWRVLIVVCESVGVSVVGWGGGCGMGEGAEVLGAWM